ncbi:hypothetical protein ACFVH6_23615 [Spirillospora sp. NPDC127200]
MGERAAEVVAVLQLGTCGGCGRARYLTRREARRAARIAAPSARLRAYRCGSWWHLGVPAGRPEFITCPVTVAPQQAPTPRGLELSPEDKRRYRSRRRPTGTGTGRRDRRRRAVTGSPSDGR